MEHKTTENNGAQYAKRPRHQLRNKGAQVDTIFKVRTILNILFILSALLGVCLYLYSSLKPLGTIILIIAVMLKIDEVSLRILRK